MLRSEPREPRDLMIASKNGWLIALDNLSGLPAWLSDCLCRLATGGGFATRMLFENDEEVIFDAQRPVIINGIDDVASRSDLLDRCLLVNVPRIEASKRRTEAELWARVEEAQPRIFGALLSVVSNVLRTSDSVRLATLPRMADFAVRATAAESALGLPAGAFMDAYQANRAAGNDVALEGSPIGKAVLDFVDDFPEWIGTPTELLRLLESRADDMTRRYRNWPKNARSLGGTVKRLAPNLRDAGIAVEFGRGGKRGGRTISLTRQPEQAGNFASIASIASNGCKPGEVTCVANELSCVANDANSLDVTFLEDHVFSEGFEEADANVASDANIRGRSSWQENLPVGAQDEDDEEIIF
jgi:hypothetical protein